MTHHVQFPPYLPRGKIDSAPHPVDAAERPVLGQTVPRIEHHVLAVVQRILRQTLPWNGNASQLHYSLLRTGPPPRSVFDVIRRGGVSYPYGEIEHDVIAALMPTRVQIPHKRFLEKAFRWAQNANVHHLVSSLSGVLILTTGRTDQIAHDLVLADLRLWVKSDVLTVSR